MQRYFSEKKEENHLFLKEEDLYHIRVVMRKKEKDLIEVVYQNELYICEIENNENPKVSIKYKEEKKEKKREWVLIIPLLQEQKMDYILQKATELGVSSIIPYLAERSKIKIDSKKQENKLVRWNRICKEASEQSKRLDIPEVRTIHTLEEVGHLDGISLLCSTNEKDKTLKNLLHSFQNCDKMNMIVGPEGGFSPREEEYLIKSGFYAVTLGERIMRAETVPLFLLSAIAYEYME